MREKERGSERERVRVICDTFQFVHVCIGADPTNFSYTVHVCHYTRSTLPATEWEVKGDTEYIILCSSPLSH